VQGSCSRRLRKTHLATGLGIRAAQAGYSVLFDTATNWITRLATAHHAGVWRPSWRGSAATS